MKHKEAFAVMSYICDCGNHERIWNSRDGVTPFTIPCGICGDHMGMVHSNWQNDVYNPHFKPTPGSRYFASMTMERATQHAERNVDRMIVLGRLDESQRGAKVLELAKYYFGDGGAPDIIVAT